MGWPQGERRCKKHQEHKISKGVCPYCLRERLSLISASSSSITAASSATSSSSSPSYSSISDVSSARASPRRRAKPLMKSRSLALVIREEKEKEKKVKRKKEKKEKKEKEEKEKGRFWAKLLGGGGALKRSKTTKEKSTSLGMKSLFS